MGERGYYTIVYNGVCYSVYEQWAYFQAWGWTIAEAVRALTPDDIEIIKLTIETEKNDKLYIKHPNMIMQDVLNRSFDEIGDREPELDLFVEYVYVINLDKNKFKVKFNKFDEDVGESYPTFEFTTLDKASKDWLCSIEGHMHE